MRYGEDTLEGRFLAGERGAVDEVVRWIARVVASSSFWSLRSEWKDIHQDAMRGIIESLQQGRFDPAQDFRLYVQGVARFTALKALGRRSREPRAPDDELAVAEIPADGRVEENVVAQQLARHILEVASEECRALMQSYFLEEKSYAEIAQSVGWPVGTVKSRLFRCLEAASRVMGRRKPPF